MKNLFFNQKSKKWILSIAAMLLTVFYAQSQSKFIIGARAGGNLSGYSGLDNVQPQVGFTGGLFMQYKPWTNFGIGVDVLYSQLNTQYDVKDSIFVYKEHLKMQYVQIPILATYYFGQGIGNIVPRVMLGPSISYLLKGEFTGVGARPRGNFKEMDLGAMAGVGVNCLLSNRMWLTADARYTHSFTSILDDGSINNNSQYIMNRNVSLTVGLGISIGKIVEKTDTE